ncbi:MAG: hypothetical protein A2W31_12100 [Planctomycetes bacterium RBG_16_64_10]|nr:MAG: hypothetical protein A2W31_12100 [Planctomycetes bacterium RBG_16_64_10]
MKNSRPGGSKRRHRHAANWTFLTNHAHVLLVIALGPELRMRDIAQQVGITERAVQRIVADLIQDGFVARVRCGRRNRYQLDTQRPLRHPLLAHQPISALTALVKGKKGRVQPAPGVRAVAAPSSATGQPA